LAGHPSLVPMSRWTCPNCSFSNVTMSWHRTGKCFMCRAPKPRWPSQSARGATFSSNAIAQAFEHQITAPALRPSASDSSLRMCPGISQRQVEAASVERSRSATSIRLPLPTPRQGRRQVEASATLERSERLKQQRPHTAWESAHAIPREINQIPRVGLRVEALLSQRGEHGLQPRLMHGTESPAWQNPRHGQHSVPQTHRSEGAEMPCFVEAQETMRQSATTPRHTRQSEQPTSLRSEHASNLRFVHANESVYELGWFPSDWPPKRVFVHHVFANTWADRCGVRAGDELLVVGGHLVSGLTKREFKHAMRQRPLSLHLLSAPALPDPRAMPSQGQEGVLETARDSNVGPIEVEEVPHASSIQESNQAHSKNASVAGNGLPIHIVSKDEEINSHPQRRECTICFYDYVQGDQQISLPCFHHFHAACVGEWLCRSNECPTCRHPVFLQ